MKLYKLILALFFLFQYGIVVSQINDTINHYMFYPGSKYKISEKREIIKYDKQNLTLVIWNEVWDKKTKQWFPISKDKLIYNKQLQLESREDYHINHLNSEERLRTVYFYEYDSLGNNTLVLTKISDYKDTVFFNLAKTETLYEKGKISEVKSFRWYRNTENKCWNLTEEKRYSYDSLGRVESNFKVTDMPGLHNKKMTYSYDENDKLKEIVRSMWDDSLNEWLPLYNEKTFLNKSGNDSLMLMKNRNFISNEWTPKMKESFSYNQKGDLLEMSRMYFSDKKERWVFSNKLKITYDKKEKVITKEYSDWNRRKKRFVIRSLVEYNIHSEAVEFKNFYVFPLSG